MVINLCIDWQGLQDVKEELFDEAAARSQPYRSPSMWLTFTCLIIRTGSDN